MRECLIKIGSFCEKHKTKIIFSFIFLLGLLLRVYKLFSNQDFWFDEVVVADLIRRTPSEMVELLKFENNPPLYFFLTKVWRELFGEKEWVLRSFSTIVSLATFFPLYALAKKLFDEKIALTSALIFAISPLIVYQAAEARMYSLLLLFTTLTFLSYYQAKISSLNRYWSLTALFLIISNFTHLTSLLIYPALLIDLFTSKVSKSGWIKACVTATSTLAVSALWLIPFMLRKITDYKNNLFENDWYTSVPLDGPSYILAYISLLFKSAFGELGDAMIIETITTLLVLIPSIYIVYRFRELQNKKSINFIFIIILIPLFILSLFNISATRYFTVILSPFSILIAFGFSLIFENIKNFTKKIIIISLILSFTILGSIYGENINGATKTLVDVLIKNNVKQLLATPFSSTSKYYFENLDLEQIYIRNWGHLALKDEYLFYVLQNNWNWNKFSTWTLDDQKAIDLTIKNITPHLENKFAFIPMDNVTDKKIISHLDKFFCNKKFFNKNESYVLVIYQKDIKLSECNLSDELLSYPQ